jgi:hypothetical protein
VADNDRANNFRARFRKKRTNRKPARVIPRCPAPSPPRGTPSPGGYAESSVGSAGWLSGLLRIFLGHLVWLTFGSRSHSGLSRTYLRSSHSGRPRDPPSLFLFSPPLFPLLASLSFTSLLSLRCGPVPPPTRWAEPDGCPGRAPAEEDRCAGVQGWACAVPCWAWAVAGMPRRSWGLLYAPPRHPPGLFAYVFFFFFLAFLCYFCLRAEGGVERETSRSGHPIGRRWMSSPHPRSLSRTQWSRSGA